MVLSIVARVTSPNAVVIGMLHLLMLAMSPLVPVPDIAAPESINHGCACDDAVATKTGGARNIPRDVVGVSEIGPDPSRLTNPSYGWGWVWDLSHYLKS